MSVFLTIVPEGFMDKHKPFIEEIEARVCKVQRLSTYAQAQSMSIGLPTYPVEAAEMRYVFIVFFHLYLTTDNLPNYGFVEAARATLIESNWGQAFVAYTIGLLVGSSSHADVTDIDAKVAYVFEWFIER